MRFLAGIFLCVVTMTSTAEEIRVLSGGAAKSFIEVGRGEIELGIAVAVPQSGKQQIVADFIKRLPGPAARERLARAGYTSPE